MSRRIGSPAVGPRQSARTLGAPASPPAAAAGGQEPRRPKAGTTLPFAAALPAALLLAGCSAVGTLEPACRPLEIVELPMLGVARGTWMDDEQFVLADLHQSRLLVYGADEGLVRIVNGGESGDPALNFNAPMDIRPWGRGYVLAEGYGELLVDGDRERLLELDADLHRIDPEQDAVVGKVRLPTNAPHVGLLPGRRYWLLQEATSGMEDPLRPPIRFLLLSSAAIRAGEVPSCD